MYVCMRERERGREGERESERERERSMQWHFKALPLAAIACTRLDVKHTLIALSDTTASPQEPSARPPRDRPC